MYGTLKSDNYSPSPNKRLNLVGRASSELDQLVKGVPLQCIVRVKPNNGFQKETVKINDNRVGLVDTNGRVSDEYEVSEVFSAEASTTMIFNQTMPAYVRALIEGVNVSVFLYGSTGSGKMHTMEGKGADSGLVQLISDNVFNVLEEKRYSNPSFQFTVRIRYLEILDEEAHDLLQAGGAQSYGKQHIRVDEWEGTHVVGTQWVPIPNGS